MKKKQTLVPDQIERVIYVIRGQRVMLDSDLARLYGVTTMALNQAVKRNAERFPDDFSYQLTQQEVTHLISQNVISSLGHGGRRNLPRVFTQHGVAMLASVLKSPQAAEVNIEIIRAFVRLRHILLTPGELATQLSNLTRTVGLHDEHLALVSDILRRLMNPPDPPAVSKPKIGFRPEMKSRNLNHQPSTDGEAR